ncbi:MAG: nucleoside phosphorylase [Patescibacteria group bacterium]|jgi:uridine phosphorylase
MTGDKQYHLETSEGDLAEHCLLVGSPERATMIAETYFEDVHKVGHHRGLLSYTGLYEGMPISVVTTGMGGPSVGIVLPEAVRSGARRFIRVGSCSALWANPKPGDVAIVTAAVRLDGASLNWAPIQYPAVADYRIVTALEKAAEDLNKRHFVGIEATTDDFNEGQARPDDMGYIPERLRQTHDELVQRGVLCYSMESAAIFVWCATHGGMRCGTINAIYGNRVTNEFAVCGEEAASEIALRAMKALADKYPL